ncbi:hypothetical protein [Bifidobacterium tissieri]|uniref:hypothetical protein n=1 Tax=Bifidobacterium tissieri TaxID=1630162 RepID=UPI00123A9821|nr:hypothetical protein [Bifidobacterium tissieri]
MFMSYHFIMITLNYEDYDTEGRRHKELAAKIDGIDRMLDTPCDLTNPAEVLDLGHSLVIPKTMRAYHLSFPMIGLFIDCIEITYDEKQGCFQVRQMNLLTSRFDSGDITTVSLSRLAMDRVKRNIVGKWILIDYGVDLEPQRWRTWENYITNAPTRYASRGGEHALDDVARLYAVAKYSGTDAREEVSKRYHVSRATASRWIAKAKQQGKISEPERSTSLDQ